MTEFYGVAISRALMDDIESRIASYGQPPVVSPNLCRSRGRERRPAARRTRTAATRSDSEDGPEPPATPPTRVAARPCDPDAPLRDGRAAA